MAVQLQVSYPRMLGFQSRLTNSSLQNSGPHPFSGYETCCTEQVGFTDSNCRTYQLLLRWRLGCGIQRRYTASLLDWNFPRRVSQQPQGALENKRMYGSAGDCHQICLLWSRRYFRGPDEEWAGQDVRNPIWSGRCY